MLTTAFILLLSLFTLSSQAATGFVANVTLTENSAAFNYRGTIAGPIPFLGAYYVSVGASFDIADHKLNAEVDALVGAVYCFTGGFPSGYLAYYKGALAVQTAMTAQGPNITKLDTAQSGGFLGFAYLRITEKDPAGATVAVRNLNNIIWYYDAANSIVDNALEYYVLAFKGTTIIPDIRLGIKYISSKVVGVFEVDGVQTVVTPRNLESLFYIDNWPYANAANKLTLEVGVATAAAAATASGSLTTSGTADPMYFNVAAEAKVGGVATPVTVGAWVDAGLDVKTQFGNADLEAQLKATYAGGYLIRVIPITYPAGAQNIIQDPTAGNGPTPQYVADTGAASSLVSCSLLLLIAILFVLV